MPIYKAILKYGHSNFIFEIIEFSQPKDVVQREQHYLDLFDFDYNVLEKADSLFGPKGDFLGPTAHESHLNTQLIHWKK